MEAFTHRRSRSRGDRIVIGCPWGYDHDFKIVEKGPSQIVKEAVRQRLIQSKDLVLDLGCGKNPRNALYLALNFSCSVDGVDLEQPDLPSDLDPTKRALLNLTQGSVLEYSLQPSRYKAAILARLIQYFSPEDLKTLLERVASSLAPNGAVALSYTAEGGILNKNTLYQVEAFSHPIGSIKTLLESLNLNILHLESGAAQSTHVPHGGEPALTYDLLAQKTT